MPGRKDFGILRSSFSGDARAQHAAELYAARGFAAEDFAFATVAGHIVQLGLWTMLQTDDGVLPGDGLAAAKDATRMDKGPARDMLAALLEAKLLRQVDGGLYLVGFEDCYRPIIGRREQNRRASEKARGRADVSTASAEGKRDVSATGHADVSATNNASQRDVIVTEPAAESAQRQHDVSTASAPTVPFRAVPSRSVPESTEPHRAVPSVVADATNGHGGGASTSSLPGNGTATATDPLSPEDEAVATTIIRLLRASADPTDNAKAEQAFTAMRERTGTPTQARVFIDRFTARFADDVTKTRRPFAMARNGRKTKS